MKPKTLFNGLMVAVLVLGVLNACAHNACRSRGNRCAGAGLVTILSSRADH